MSWRVLPEDHPAQTWDGALRELPDHNVFQSSSWASHKEAMGWTPIRLVYGKKSPRAMALFFLKRYPGGRLLWSRGGPVGDPKLWDVGLRRAVGKAAGKGLLYARFCSYRVGDSALEKHLRTQGFARTKRPLNENSTIVVDISRSEGDLSKALSSNWAHNLRRGEKRCRVVRWEGVSPAGLLRLYRAMESYKGLKPQYGEKELKSLLARLRGNLIFYRADGPDGETVAFRACAVQGDGAWDLLAASTEAGRKIYAAYPLLWALLKDSKERGALSYDLGGAGSGPRDKGVTNFKRGTGGSSLAYLGEWEWARPCLLRAPASAAVALKMSLSGQSA